MASNMSTPKNMEKRVSMKEKQQEIAQSILEAIRALDSKRINVVICHLEVAMTKSLDILDKNTQKK